MKQLLVLLIIAGLAVGALGCLTGDEVPAPTVALPEKARTISVFYATGRTLVEEKHTVADDANIATTALNEVLAAKPQMNTEIAIVQPECKVLDVAIDKKGLATVDFRKEVLSFDAVDNEKVLAYAAILQTLKQFDNIKSVKFVVEGKETGRIGGKDIQAFWGKVSLKGQPWLLNKKK